MLRLFEITAWIAAIALLAVYAGARTSAERARADGIAEVQHARYASAITNGQGTFPLEPPDTSTWSPSRIAGWRETSHKSKPPQAVLRIPAVGLEVPVFDGTSDTNLNRGAGRIEGTARIGPRGNLGLAAHRDGYFRALKDIRVGAEVHLETPRDVLSYRVVSTSIVDPSAIEVLAPTSTPSITLVTCYPFYFIGSAPQRFIVRAELNTTAPSKDAATHEK